MRQNKCIPLVSNNFSTIILELLALIFGNINSLVNDKNNVKILGFKRRIGSRGDNNLVLT